MSGSPPTCIQYSCVLALRRTRILGLFLFPLLIAGFGVPSAQAAPHPSGSDQPSGSVTITIKPTTVSLLSLQTVQFTAAVKGSTDAGVTWSRSSGTITSTGLYTAPWVDGNTTATVTATSKADKTKSATATVNLAPIPPVLITTPSGLPNALTNAGYSQALAATGGTPPYSWELTVNSLPTGMTLNSNGTILGSTNETGSFTFWVRASDSSKYQKQANQSFTINVNLNMSGSPVPSNFFGMHMDLMGTPWPSSPIVGQRLWDSDVTWALINTAEGVYSWTNLDTRLSEAQEHKADVLYNLSMTPAWAQCSPTTSSPCVQTPGCGSSDNYGGGPGQCYWPGDLNADGTGTNQHWKDWVTAVATHSVNSTTAHIKYYEIWNEPNVNEFWRGTTAQLVRLAQDAYCIIKGIGSNCTNTAIDPNALIVSPSSALGGDAINASLTDYFSQGGAAVTDVIAFHGYNATDDTKIPSMVSAVRDGAQTQYGLLSKPLFDDEFSWGANVVFPDPDERAGFVARSVLLHWSSGVSRLYWYAWDTAGTMWSLDSGTGCTTPDGSGLGFSCTDALAWTVVQQWIVGTTLSQPCQENGTVWTCTFTKSGGFQALAVWDSSQSCNDGVCTTSTYTLPSGTNYTQYEDLAGDKHTISGKTVQIGYRPIFLEN